MCFILIVFSVLGIAIKENEKNGKRDSEIIVAINKNI
jgi:hypothetical protein